MSRRYDIPSYQLRAGGTHTVHTVARGIEAVRNMHALLLYLQRELGVSADLEALDEEIILEWNCGCEYTIDFDTQYVKGGWLREAKPVPVANVERLQLCAQHEEDVSYLDVIGAYGAVEHEPKRPVQARDEAERGEPAPHSVCRR